MGILLALAAALCWGAADFLVRYSTRIIGTYRTLLFMQAIGAAALSIYMGWSGELAQLTRHVGWQAWTWAIMTAGLNVVSALALYRSFEVGIISVVSPVAASSAALTVLLSFLSGETLSNARIIGISAALIGVALAAAHSAPASETLENGAGLPARKRQLTKGVGWALLSSIGYGVNFWMLGFLVSPALGGTVPIWIIRVGTIVTLTLLAAPARQNIRVPVGRQVWGLLLAIGVLDTTAYITANYGLLSDQVAVVSVLLSLFSAVTVLLAWIFLREQLQWSQWLGIAIIFAGVALVNV